MFCRRLPSCLNVEAEVGFKSFNPPEWNFLAHLAIKATDGVAADCWPAAHKSSSLFTSFTYDGSLSTSLNVNKQSQSFFWPCGVWAHCYAQKATWCFRSQGHVGTEHSELADAQLTHGCVQSNSLKSLNCKSLLSFCFDASKLIVQHPDFNERGCCCRLMYTGAADIFFFIKGNAFLCWCQMIDLAVLKWKHPSVL